MGMSAGNDSGGPMAEINVVPLVDVMLVLLIIFMVTTPLMNHRVKVQLPEAVLDVKPDMNDKIPPITIAVTESGELFWNDEPITRQLIESRLSVEAQKLPQPMLNIRGDRTTPYRLINEVVKIAQSQGMRKVGFVTTPPKRGT